MVSSLNTGVPARDFRYQAVQYLRKQITFAVQAAAVVVGKLPAGAAVIGGGVFVTTAFNAGTTNPIDVGYSVFGADAVADPNAFATLLAGQTPGFQALDELATSTNTISTGEREVTVTYTPTGTAATAGVAEVIVMYAMT